MQSNKSSACKQPRYELLDGLRGVAAVIVIWYHFFEGFATTPVDQMLNHGYLAVDFFFVLSGFVIGYAYDGRMRPRGAMSGRAFMLRRIIRLHPMVVLAVVLGALSFVLQGCEQWDGSRVPLGMVLVALLLGLFLIPVLPGMAAEVRGNGEMFPLNGPSWSLFFEYIGSILYAVALCRASKRTLAWITAVSGIALTTASMTNLSGAYHLGFGWSVGTDGLGLLGGFLRLMFSFSAGLLMQRCFKARRIRGAFWICSAIVCAVLACPYIGGPEPSVLNAVYDSAATLFIFPAVVYIGACGITTDRFSTASCDFLGRLSYPVYIIHYPVMYLFYSWVWTNGLSFSQVWPVCTGLFVLIIAMAWISMKYYDEPVRKWLTARFIQK